MAQRKTDHSQKLWSVFIMVGVAGFELATPCTPCKCATRLRYTPKNSIIYSFLLSNRKQRTNLQKLLAHSLRLQRNAGRGIAAEQRRGSRRSEEHTSELQSPCNLECRL